MSDSNKGVCLEISEEKPTDLQEVDDCEDENDIISMGDEYEMIKPDDVDAMVAEELSHLSHEDREKAYFDIHGVNSEVNETPALIERALAEFDVALRGIVSKEGYNIAMQAEPSFVTNPKFRLRFLRSERFDAKKAAERFSRHFELKLELFGPDLLCRDVRQDDLDEATLDALYNGCSLDLPLRDRAGRLVVFKAPELCEDINVIKRKAFYSAMVYTEDEETQRKGYVIAACLFGKNTWFYDFVKRMNVTKAQWEVQHAVPMRLEAIHMCTNSTMWRRVFAIAKYTGPRSMRVRSREHIGSMEDMHLKLQSFGILVEQIPLERDGSIRKKVTAQRWERRRTLERRPKAEKSEVALETPGCNDVLMGRGKACYRHVGNVRFRKLVQEKYLDYEEANLSGKKAMSRDILLAIKAESGRVLKDDGSCWVEVDDTVAIRKIAHAFRTLRSVVGQDGIESKEGKIKRTQKRSLEES